MRAEFAVALRVSEASASRSLEQAQLLVEDLPMTRAALAGARILWESGRIVCAVAATLPVASRAAFDERAARLAVSLTPTQLRRALARLREELHEQPLAERHRRAREDRAVWITPEIDGMATLSALLPAPPAIGAFARLDRLARTLREGRAGAGEHGDQRRDEPCDDRTLAQLRADALADLLCDGDVSGTSPGEPGAPTFVPGVRAEIRLTLPATTAAGLDDSPADLDGYGPVPADVARELVAGGASFTRVATDPGAGTVVSVGRTLRVPPPGMRLHLQLRDQTCRFPGCTRPASRTEADHAVECRHGGETALRNLASLCVAHHHVRHGDRWTYVLHPDGTADWTTPTGRRVTTRPGPVPGAPPGSGPRFATRVLTPSPLLGPRISGILRRTSAHCRTTVFHWGPTRSLTTTRRGAVLARPADRGGEREGPDTARGGPCPRGDRQRRTRVRCRDRERAGRIDDEKTRTSAPPPRVSTSRSADSRRPDAPREPAADHPSTAQRTGDPRASGSP
ncbi:HNH endonuclease [Rathayibacter caricis]|uniref:HNH endonuclease signature motif containing protein n=1 Tax=Rathayibacter caricis TaxID=110936 RepID=UPI001FB5317B|nr:HNH endonuclease signature motif containing protein [Rathayibacter caricis]MCJ1695781.1 HNH endonuclease [Rathayibacter caricis]